jgi:methyl-accepting chemotaxis protein
MTDLSGAVAPAAAMQRAIAVLAAVDRTQGLVEYDLDGRVLDANQNFLDLMGYTIEQIVGRDHRMFCTQDYINDEMYGDLWRAMTQGLAETGEYIRVTSSGKHVWLQGSYNRCSMTRAMWSKSSGPARDITDGKIRAADHDGKMAAINRVHAVVEFSTSGSILSANDNFSTIFGYEREEVLGKHHRMFCDREDVLAPEYAEFWEKLAAGETTSANSAAAPRMAAASGSAPPTTRCWTRRQAGQDCGVRVGHHRHHQWQFRIRGQGGGAEPRAGGGGIRPRWPHRGGQR